MAMKAEEVEAVDPRAALTAAACLRDCGLVVSRPVGRASVFSLTQPEAVNRLLCSAEELLALTGHAVVLCPVHGVRGAGSRGSRRSAR